MSYFVSHTHTKKSLLSFDQEILFVIISTACVSKNASHQTFQFRAGLIHMFTVFFPAANDPYGSKKQKQNNETKTKHKKHPMLQKGCMLIRHSKKVLSLVNFSTTLYKTSSCLHQDENSKSWCVYCSLRVRTVAKRHVKSMFTVSFILVSCVKLS